MNKFFYRVQQFMIGRNGLDKLNRFLFVIYLILVLINIFISSLILYIIELMIAAFIVFRTLSKNLYRRQRENLWYINAESSVKSFFIRQKNKCRDIKTHRYIRCKCCKAQLRVKRRKGRHTVRCPKCKNEFSINIRF